MAAIRARKAGKADTLPITERDIPIGIVGLVTLVCMMPIAWVLGVFREHERARRASVTTLVIGGVVYVVLDEFLRFGGLRLHGGADWFVEQPAFRHWNSGGDRRGLVACVGLKPYV